MQKVIVLFAILGMLNSYICFSSPESPQEVAEKIFGLDSIPNILDYCTGTYKGSPCGLDFKPEVKREFRTLEILNNTAVVAMKFTGADGKGSDCYLFFQKKSTWKLSAFRGLAMGGMIEMMIKELEQLTPQQIDTLLEESNNDTLGLFSNFTSKEDIAFTLNNAKLTIDFDDNIIEHFNKNKTEFNRLKDSALAEYASIKRPEDGPTALITLLQADYRKILISKISYDDYILGNCLVFLIGGMLDNTVGYIYVKNPSDVPKMNPDSIILIREIGDGWYLYKTT